MSAVARAEMRIVLESDTKNGTGTDPLKQRFYTTQKSNRFLAPQWRFQIIVSALRNWSST